MVKFWGLLFGINFAMGVATGITMEFQFGTNWAYYSHYVGDMFGAPLAIEGLMAFFLEATFVGLFFFGWDRLSQGAASDRHLAAGARHQSVGAVDPDRQRLDANPVGARFNVDTMRMEVTDFTAVLFNPVAQAKFVHTVSAGYVTGSMFVLAISAWYLLRGRHIDFRQALDDGGGQLRPGLALSVVVLGDESGYTAGKPEDENRRDRGDVGNRAGAGLLHHNSADLGYALLLKRNMEDPTRASPEDIKRAAASTIPNVPVLFWAFRLMVGCGFWFIGLFAFSFWLASTRKLTRHTWFLQAALFSLPLPWIAAELGWVVAEYGRQPWAIEGILPTSLAVSSVTTAQVATSLAGFVLFYSVLAAVDLVLMRKYIRKGPDGLGMWPQA
jgi:cytochrome bd-type quinol oxidase subunit 1